MAIERGSFRSLPSLKQREGRLACLGKGVVPAPFPVKRGPRRPHVPQGGAELACMSTSSDLNIVASYAQSRQPLLFRIKVDSPMELGAELGWLSMYPGEAEVLYPPLTFAKPLFKQTIKGLVGGMVVTLKPSFPS